MDTDPQLRPLTRYEHEHNWAWHNEAPKFTHANFVIYPDTWWEDCAKAGHDPQERAMLASVYGWYLPPPRAIRNRRVRGAPLNKVAVYVGMVVTIAGMALATCKYY